MKKAAQLKNFIDITGNWSSKGRIREKVLVFELMKTIVFLLGILVIFFPLPGRGQEAEIYGEDWKLRDRIGDGRIYDRYWERKGSVEGDRVYDMNGKFQYCIEGDRIYDKDWKLKGYIKDDRNYDRSWRPKGRIIKKM
jgi:hypothetical protein